MNHQNYKDFCCFHNYWRSHLVYEGLNTEKQRAKHKNWWKVQPQPRVNCKLEKNSKQICGEIDGEQVSLTKVRQEILCKEYSEIVRKEPRYRELVQFLKKGQSLAIYCYDGPRGPYDVVTSEEASLESIKDAMCNEAKPFGHGYVLAKCLLEDSRLPDKINTNKRSRLDSDWDDQRPNGPDNQAKRRTSS